MLVQAVSPRPLVDFSREEVNEKCPVCWETTEEDNGKLWCAHEHANADLTDGTRIIVLVSTSTSEGLHISERLHIWC